MNNLLWSAAIMVLMVSGCGWNGTPTRGDDFSPLTSISISAVTSTIAAGTSTKLKATGHISGLGTRDITDQVTWSSDTASVATFNVSGRVTGVAVGSAIVTATLGTISATHKVTVSSATILSIAVTPATPSVAKGLSQQLNATGTFSDSSTQNITIDAVWSSSATTYATVSDAESSKGLAKALAIGASTITATFGGVPGSTEMTVTKAVVKSIDISPANPSALSLSNLRFTATGTYTDDTTADITSTAAWSSSGTSYATMSGDVAKTLAPGSSAISATLEGISGSTTLTVTGGSLSSIAVSPATSTLAKDTTTRIKAVGTFTSGSVISTRDITGAVSWTTADSTLATMTPGGGNLEWLNAVAVTSGTTVTATATESGKTGTATLTVTPPTLYSIALSPITFGLTAGTSNPLTVTATFSDNSTQDVTAFSTFDTDDATKATVSDRGLANGRVTAVAAGTTTINASYGGKTAPTPTTVIVTSRTLQSLSVSLSPSSSNVSVGNQVSYGATAIYIDGITEDVTADTTTVWSVTPSNVAVLADSTNQPGQVVAVSSGSASLTATFGDKSTSVTITVP